MPKTSDLELHLSSDDIKWAKQWLANNGISNDKPIVAIIPGGGASWGAEADKKRWPAAKYAEVIDKIIADYKATVILMGDAKDEQACSAIARLAKSPVHSSVGKTTLLQMAALMKQCRLAILNDGGPLHVAAAEGLRTVSIFGPVDEMVYGPFPSMGHAIVKKNLACQPCYRRFRVAACAHLSCIKDLSVEDVYKKVIERLSQSHEHSLH